jgi:hypothetical protein
MGYLNNTTVTVDAILTKKGRELLAKGGSAFNITQFALSDDEIDYDLWNQSHPLGDSKMGIVIENLPITEAVPDETQSMKYKLITLPEGTKSIPYISTGGITAISLSEDNAIKGFELNIETLQWNEAGLGALTIDSAQSYSVTLLDSTYFNVLRPKTGTNASAPTATGKTLNWIITQTSTQNSAGLFIGVPSAGAQGTWQPQTLNGKSTKLIITNIQYGSRLVIPISYTQTGAV